MSPGNISVGNGAEVCVCQNHTVPRDLHALKRCYYNSFPSDIVRSHQQTTVGVNRNDGNLPDFTTKCLNASSRARLRKSYALPDTRFS